jgi:hypothetical protein
MSTRRPDMYGRQKVRFAWGAVAVAGLAASLVVSGNSGAHAMPILLQITSLANRTVVYADQTVTFVAAPIAGDSLTKVWVDGPRPFGASQMVSNPPYQLSLGVPQEIAAGKYAIRAYGGRAG